MGVGRDLGIDLAWGWALLGLIAWTRLDPGSPSLGSWLFDGTCVILVALLAGAGVVLAARRRVADGDLGGALRATMARGLLLAAFGLVLGTAAFSIPGFLVPVGVAVAAAAVALLLPTWAIALLAALSAALGGWVVAESRMWLAHLEHVPSLTTLVLDPFGTVQDVVLTGEYPALALLAPVLLGVIVARVLERGDRGSRRRALLGAIAIAGALLAGIAGGARWAIEAWIYGELYPLMTPAASGMAWNAWITLVPYSVEEQLLGGPAAGSALEVARASGLALLTIGLLGLLATVLRGRARVWASPAQQLGATAISGYALWAIGVTAVGELSPEAREMLASALGVGISMLVVLLCLVLLLRRGRGPLEGLIDDLAERAAGGRQPLRVRPVLTGDESLDFEVQLRAPIERVWEALTDPALMQRWTEQPEGPVLRSAGELQPGDVLRWHVATPFGTSVLLIETHRLDAPSTFVTSLRRGGGPVEMTSTDRLFEFDGVTTIRTRNTYASRLLRDRAAAGSWRHTCAYRRLADLVERPTAASGTMVA